MEQAETPSTCAICGKPLPATSRRHSLTCSTTCSRVSIVKVKRDRESSTVRQLAPSRTPERAASYEWHELVVTFPV
jgi:hypothetical protein